MGVCVRHHNIKKNSTKPGKHVFYIFKLETQCVRFIYLIISNKYTCGCLRSFTYEHMYLLYYREKNAFDYLFFYNLYIWLLSDCAKLSLNVSIYIVMNNLIKTKCERL